LTIIIYQNIIIDFSSVQLINWPEEINETLKIRVYPSVLF